MSHSSDNESSDSSDDFLVSADKIDLNSSFFTEKSAKAKTNLKAKRNVTAETSDDEEDYDFVNDKHSADIFSQVLKNLQSTNFKQSHDDSTENANKSKQKSIESNGQDNVLSNEIKELLLQGESGTSIKKEESCTDDEENVKEATVPTEYSIPKEGVKITLPGESLMIGRKKRGKADLQTVLKNRINQRLRTSQVLIHKVSLLCWLAYGFYLNQRINDSELMSVALTVVPINNCPKGRIDLTYLEKFTKWFRKMFTFKVETKNECITKDILLTRLKNKNAFNYKELVLLYIVTLRAIGLKCRLIISLCPPRLKVPSDKLFKTKAEIEKEKERQKEKEKTNESAKTKHNQEKKTAEKKNKKDSTSVSKKVKKEEVSEELVVPENSPTGRKNANLEARKKAAAILQAKSARTRGQKNEALDKAVKDETDSNDEIVSKRRRAELHKQGDSKKEVGSKRTKAETHKQDGSKKEVGSKRTKAETHKKDSSEKEVGSKRTRAQTHKQNDSKDTSSNTDLDESTSLSRKLRSRIAKEADPKKNDDKITLHKAKKGKKVEAKPSTSTEVMTDDDYEPDEQYDSDEDFVIKHPAKRKINTSDESSQSKTKSKGQKYRKLLSSDEESDDEEKFKNSEYIWAEVYVESEESWISVSVTTEKIHCVNELYKKATKPVLYVIAWNVEGSLKDVTRRYCPQWLTVTRKKRVDEKWWRQSLSPWKERDTPMSKAEDEMLLQKELEQPLPKTIGECKGHPLYALARHLLKYEGLYPPDVVPLGHLPNGEAIYSRHCVHTLCSRETWIKQARVVKPAQEPYKIVKAMPKYDKLSGVKLKDQPLELFGIWQTTEYVPPEAKNGIVPRNEYGNVDLFKQCMLPKGTVHINLPALNRVARKLNIDCAPAVVGFNFGCMGAVPAFEGFVVCSEYEDTLREAWEAEQVEIARRAKEKREQRIYGNWKKLIKGLIIRERLAAKYGFQMKDDEVGASTSNKRTKQKTTTVKKAKAS